MFRNPFRSPRGMVTGGIALLALFAVPFTLLAQHGGGGHGGGMGGGGLSGGGRGTGVSAKDDLKDFHAALAVQASSQQVVAFAAMLKSTAVAAAEMQGLLKQLSKEHDDASLASRGTSLEQAIETARTENNKFLAGLSATQKSGLKETIKKLSKADSDLEQQTKQLDQESGAKPMGADMASSAQSLDRTLSGFQNQQIGLAKEMGIDDSENQGFAYELPRFKYTVNFANQPVEITTSGLVSKGVSEGGQNTFAVELTTDMTDLQHNITDVLHAQLDKADRCGERVTIRNAELTPQAPASLVMAQLHFERWSCVTISGRQSINEMAEGNGSIEVKLTPAVSEDGRLRLVAQIGRIEAEGMLGESLRSGSLGEELRDQAAALVLSTVRRGDDVLLPPAAKGYATMRRARFLDSGSGSLSLVMDGEIRVSNDKVSGFTAELKERSPVADVGSR